MSEQDHEFFAAALPNGREIWEWAVGNSPQLAKAVELAINATTAHEYWTAIKIIGDLLVELFDPATSPAAIKSLAVTVPWDQVVTLLIPIVIDLIRQRREKKGN